MDTPLTKLQKIIINSSQKVYNQLEKGHNENIYHILGISLIAKLITFSSFGMFKGMWRYTSLIDISNIV